MKEKWEKSCGTLHTLPEPPPSVDGGKKGGAGSDGKYHCQQQSNEMSNIKRYYCHFKNYIIEYCAS